MSEQTPEPASLVDELRAAAHWNGDTMSVDEAAEIAAEHEARWQAERADLLAALAIADGLITDHCDEEWPRVEAFRRVFPSPAPRQQPELQAFRNLLAIVFGDGGQRTAEFRNLVEAGAAAEQVAAAAEQIAAAARQEAQAAGADRDRLNYLDRQRNFMLRRAWWRDGSNDWVMCGFDGVAPEDELYGEKVRQAIDAAMTGEEETP